MLIPLKEEHAVCPIWTGTAFVGQDNSPQSSPTPVLSFNVGKSGWTTELTQAHEDNVGNDHYIDCASRDHALTQIQQHLDGQETSRNHVVLEVGCSSGYFLKHLRQNLPNVEVIGSDYVLEPLHAVAQRVPGVPLLQFDITRCPLADNSLDAVVMLNVLEHIEDDAAALSEVYRILRPGGIAIIEVPAGPHLYDVYDKQLLHFRRYRLADICDLATSQGFGITLRSHLGFFLYPAFWLTKKYNRRHLNTSAAEQEKIFRRSIKASAGSHPWLHYLMHLEGQLRRVVDLPWGIRCLITCKKP